MNPLNLPLAEGIRKIGFRKWYERELLTSHAHMILAFLSIVGMMAAFEAFAGASLSEKLFDAAAMLICASVGLRALRRYLKLLMNAENIANQANCPQCNAYGLFTCLSDARSHAAHVRCKQCAYEWRIEP